jgi:hypothetical protein
VSTLIFYAFTADWIYQIPIVWERFLAEAEIDHKTASARYPAALKAYEKKSAVWEKWTKNGNRPTSPKKPFQRMQPGEDTIFLRFATALKYFGWKFYSNGRAEEGRRTSEGVSSGFREGT